MVVRVKTGHWELRELVLPSYGFNKNVEALSTCFSLLLKGLVSIFLKLLFEKRINTAK